MCTRRSASLERMFRNLDLTDSHPLFSLLGRHMYSAATHFGCPSCCVHAHAIATTLAELNALSHSTHAGEGHRTTTTQAAGKPRAPAPCATCTPLFARPLLWALCASTHLVVACCHSQALGSCTLRYCSNDCSNYRVLGCSMGMGNPRRSWDGYAWVGYGLQCANPHKPLGFLWVSHGLPRVGGWATGVGGAVAGLVVL